MTQNPMERFYVEHELKCSSEYFNRIQTGQKTFEIRKNDRNFQVGDVLILRDYCSKNKEYIGYSTPLRARIIYMTDYAQQADYVVLGIAVEEQEQ